ncbi:hypothetical protein COCC4DRAFT_57442 [Bipolaris maydis ATCC 48331]|uniref:Uncharacterized protein n=2 Tax=Cochliobolus heterostrophus TaxID=5016 RepID=M2UCV1_COCH5|nr:uncharacterized protein COCC4DRAFT_57442 [Bipolaris maydis ATCC 48331]EMD91531.1 hypothetical protein COCHEDRAFT_1102249 [Bipolaris maydis C5]ENI08711.1 hypothetical protein COCC4DRAFT_57442 [Bipolaris maydis ATCC 48331]
MWWRRHHPRAQPCLVYEVVPGCQTHPTYRSLAQCPRCPRCPPGAPLLSRRVVRLGFGQTNKQQAGAASCSQPCVSAILYVHPSIHWWYMQSVHLPGRW